LHRDQALHDVFARGECGVEIGFVLLDGLARSINPVHTLSDGDALFTLGTGQAGILIRGQGVARAAGRGDYAAGAVEAAVLQAAQGAGPEALVLVEGQGSLAHPGSTATLPLLRGSQPTDLLLVHRAGQSHVRTRPGAVPVAIPPLPELIAACEALAALGRPDGLRPRVRAIALNTALLEAEPAAAATHAVADATGLAVVDPVRQGGEALLAAVLAGAGAALPDTAL
jgi:uncharacterized NAD-dependent epimerase/dehydratase family protein